MRPARAATRRWQSGGSGPTRLIVAGVFTELLLRLRERELRRELQHSDPGRVRELQEALQRLLEKVAALSSA